MSEADNVDIVEGAVEIVLADLVAAGARYDIALLDPPSSGLNIAIAQALTDLHVERIVYVSGDLASLARDCSMLVDAGYHLREIQAIDLAPQTWYISAVAVFER